MRAALLACAVALAGCSGWPWTPRPPEVVDTSCVTFRPIILTESDAKLVLDGAISQDLVDQILTHNETGARRCGW